MGQLKVSGSFVTQTATRSSCYVRSCLNTYTESHHQHDLSVKSVLQIVFLHSLETPLPLFLKMALQHTHCVTCLSQRCMTRPEPGISCDLVTCPLVCGAIFHTCKGPEHRLLCPLERVPCLNSGFGCPATLVRTRIPAHLEVCPAGVVCCTMEWNRWPISCLDYTSYESLSWGVEETEQLDMALALQDQHTLIESLKVVAMAPTVERQPPVVAVESEKDTASDSAVLVVADPIAATSESPPPLTPQSPPPLTPPLGSAKDKIANGINGLNEERYSKLYEATVETARSLAAALDVLSSANNTSDNNTEQHINGGAVLGPQHSENSSDRNEELLLHNRLEVKGPVAEGVNLKECYGQLHQLHQATVQLRRSLVTALGDLGNTVKYTDPINGGPSHPQAEPNSSFHQLEDADSIHVEMKDAEAGSSVGPLRVVSRTDSAVAMNVVADGNMQMELLGRASKSVERMDGHSLCNGCLSGEGSQKRPQEQVLGSDSADQQQPGTSWSTSETVCLVKVQDDLNLSPVPQGSCVSQSQTQPQSHPDPPLAPPLHIHQGIAHRASHVVLEDRGLERKFQNHQLLRGLGQFALSNGRRVRVRFRPKMEDKAVDTSDLEQEDDPMGLGEIDLITAALLFCLEESRKCRRISETTYVDGFHVDFGTQTFTFPAAILVTSTRVGDVASAAACDHAPQLSYPSPFRTLRLDLVLEEVPQIRNMPCNRLQQMFSFVCGQLFRRDEYSSHFKNVHEDIHAGLNGWMEHRCPLAYYGCTYSQRRFCPSSQGSKVIHDRNLRSFGVQPSPVGGEPLGESQSDQFSGLPFEVLEHVARFLDGFSLCQLSVVSRTMRDVCASLLQSRGIVELRWERRQYPNGTFSWQIKDRVWRFSTAFSPVIEWRFAEVSSMSDHLRTCRYNTIERKMEAVPLPSMCTARDRSLLSILKLQEQHMT
ncbi:F-box only protein 30-like isoform X1 [Oncorhynchus nerka]|uniref:F-box only protein 30-like isoform X1 n=2 Tax=Oncorhynchus nerka TaxID=8023 RepID=UPI0031B7EB28